MMIQQKPNESGLNLMLELEQTALTYFGVLIDVIDTTICDFGEYTVIVYADGVKRTINNSFFNSKEHCREVFEGILENKP